MASGVKADHVGPDLPNHMSHLQERGPGPTFYEFDMGGIHTHLIEGGINGDPAIHITFRPGVIEEAHVFRIDETTHKACGNATGARKGCIKQCVGLALSFATMEHL